MELRGKYLFHLSRICHIDANQVDALCVYDFFTYILNVDEWLKYEKKMNEQQRG